MSALWVRASPQIDRALDLARDRLDGLEVARRGDREAGLDHVDAEPRELLGDLDLLLGVAARSRATARRRAGWCRRCGPGRRSRTCRCRIRAHRAHRPPPSLRNRMTCVFAAVAPPSATPPAGGRRRRSARLSSREVIRSAQGSAPRRRRRRAAMVAERIEARAVMQGRGDRARRDRPRAAARARRRRGPDDDPLAARGDLPRPRAQPAGRPGRAGARAGALAAALARDPRRLPDLLRRLPVPGPERDPADRPRGRAARDPAPGVRRRTSRPGRRTATQFARAQRQVRPHQAARVRQASQLPATLGDAAGAARDVTVGVLKQPGRRDHRPHPRLLPAPRRRAPVRAAASRIRGPHREPGPQGGRADRARRALLRHRSTCCWRSLAGLFTWLSLELLGVRPRAPAGSPRRHLRPRAADRVHDRGPARRGGRRPARRSRPR